MDKDKVLDLLDVALMVTERVDKNDLIKRAIKEIDQNRYDEIQKMFDYALKEAMERKK
jgi:hypothetical protein